MQHQSGLVEALWWYGRLWLSLGWARRCTVMMSQLIDEFWGVQGYAFSSHPAKSYKTHTQDGSLRRRWTCCNNTSNPYPNPDSLKGRKWQSQVTWPQPSRNILFSYWRQSWMQKLPQTSNNWKPGEASAARKSRIWWRPRAPHFRQSEGWKVLKIVIIFGIASFRTNSFQPLQVFLKLCLAVGSPWIHLEWTPLPVHI